ncbi:AGE family epimerase/isomerase [Schaalia sp. Marseille-Q2122]|uniref:AGE family epimerase/isomerase n=1 Tax=Schaalia sp. Marseille-Q2122 TaxID=2736604 RepID=UPI00158A0094|nr:AGE family epimerase/isomerase [Schaalia sp. Marseille-Q2122]
MTIPPTLRSAFLTESRALIDFARHGRTSYGFGWLDDEGHIDPSYGTRLWITGRMTHAFALGHLLGFADCLPYVRHGVDTLLNGPLYDAATRSWVSSVDADGTPDSQMRVSYDHSFVILAASSALAAGIDEANTLLTRALETFDALWWDEAAGMVVDARDPETMEVDSYRGVNANMHSVEALLAAFAANGDQRRLKQALRISSRVVGFIEANEHRLPEHFDEQWRPMLSYNEDIPADAFRPFGSTIGHWLEWSRLILTVAAECQAHGVDYPASFDVLPAYLYRKSLAEGWGRDGAPGFVYTIDFAGTPVVRQRMHWVLCEAIGAAAALAHTSADESYWHDIADYWDYAQRYLIDPSGCWHEELNERNEPAPCTWTGKPDIYHALQAMIVGTLPLRPAFAWALKEQAG